MRGAWVLLTVLGSLWAARGAGPLLEHPEYFSTEAEAVEALRIRFESLQTASGAIDSSQLDKESGGSELTFAMNRGWWTLANALIENYRAAGVDISSYVYQLSSQIRRQLQTLQDALSQQRFATGIAPAFQWAQSVDSVFLNVKFAHKWDTPATLGCKDEHFAVEHRNVTFRVLCKDKRKRFELKMELFKAADADLSSVSFNSVGRALITLRKANKGTWTRLLRRRDERPGNMHTWWAMKEKYEGELKDFNKPNASPSSTPAAAAAAAASNGSEVTTDGGGGGSAIDALAGSNGSNSTAAQGGNVSGPDPAPLSTATAEDDDDDDEADDEAGDAEAAAEATPLPGKPASVGAAEEEDDEADDGDDEPDPSTAAAPTTTEVPKHDSRRDEILRLMSRQRKELEAKERAEMLELDASARRDKNNIDQQARESKARVDQQLATAKDEVRRKFDAARQESRKTLEAQLAELTQ